MSSPRPQAPFDHSAENMTGAATRPKPSFSGRVKFRSAALTPGATSKFGMSATQVSVGARKPILPRRIEHVDIQSILERHRAMRHIRRNHQHFTGAHDLFVLPGRAQTKVQRAL